MMRAIRRSVLAAMAGALFCAFQLAGAPARAAADEAGGGGGGITVRGVGTAKGRPSVVEIGARVTGEGVLAADASVKFNDTKKKAVAALEALKDPNLTLHFEGPSVGIATDPQAQVRVMQGMGAADTAKQKVQVSEQVRLVLKVPDETAPDKLLALVLKVIDTAKDAGLQVGAPPANYIQMQIRAQLGGGDEIAVFKIPDKSDLEAQAYEMAVADAKAKADRLAKLAGVKLGRILSVQGDEAAAPGGTAQSVVAAIYGEGAAAAATSDAKAVEATAFGEIPVTAHVTVKFEIEK